MADPLFTVPIDDQARDGTYQLVFGGASRSGPIFACVRWTGEDWVFPGGLPLDWPPRRYRPLIDHQIVEFSPASKGATHG